jgi:hypothetical protein
MSDITLNANMIDKFPALLEPTFWLGKIVTRHTIGETKEIIRG